MSVSADACKQMFVALRLHFTTKYDFIKYNGKTRAAVKPNETYHVGRIVHKYHDPEQIRNFFVSNMIHSYIVNGKIDGYIGSYISKDNVEIYDKWTSWWNAMTYNLKTDIAKFDNIQDMIKIEDGDHPKVFTEFLSGKISINTIACLMIAIKSLKSYWEKNCNDEVLFGSHLQLLEKYLPFAANNQEAITQAIKKIADFEKSS